MNIFAVLPAAGCGSRTGLEKNKILHPVGGIPILRRTVDAFYRHEAITKIVLAVNPAEKEEIRSMLAQYREKILFAEGGNTRTESVKNALERIAAQDPIPDYVLIHDAARPFVTKKILDDCIATVLSHGSAVCALPCTDTLVCAEFGMITRQYDRSTAYTLQTPQGFSFSDLLLAYRNVSPEQNFTDDSGVYAKYIAPPFLFQGDPCNRKITFSEDFRMNEYRTGIGIDTHAFGSDKNYILLGGVKIPSERGLVAHSDGDVLVHAVMDALLSAAGLRDIGCYFPDTDPAYQDADSLALLEKVAALLSEKGYTVTNISAAIVAERPKLAPHIDAMKKNIAAALNLAADQIGISAGTNEKLGFLGRGEGITVTANALLRTIG